MTAQGSLRPRQQLRKQVRTSLQEKGNVALDRLCNGTESQPGLSD